MNLFYYDPGQEDGEEIDQEERRAVGGTVIPALRNSAHNVGCRTILLTWSLALTAKSSKRCLSKPFQNLL